MKYQVPRGTKDILPEEAGLWQHVEDTAREVFSLYNYGEIRTPVFESTELFTRSIGKTTEIVSKEMYSFKDKGDRDLTLRPEETASVVRSCLENNLIGDNRITKLYYIGPMFRYERPQAGRYRQFHQAGIEVFGSSSPWLDVEVIALGVRFFDSLRLEGLEVSLNSVGCPVCRSDFLKKLKGHFEKVEGELCEDCKTRLKTNPLRILDCKADACQPDIRRAPSTVDTLCEECSKHFDAVKKGLDGLDIKYIVNARLVRGLDYYNRTVFEIISSKLGAQNAVCGGGRYDNLVEELGGKPCPAAGFAVGLERLIEIIGKQKDGPTAGKPLKVYVITLDGVPKVEGFKLAERYRSAGLKAEVDLFERGLKAQMKQADRSGAEYALILGEEEYKSGKATLKALSSGKQETLEIEKIFKEIEAF